MADELLALTDGAGSMLFAGLVASSREDEDEAAQLYAECARLAREEGDSWLVSIAVNDLGNSVLKGGEYELALELFEESLAIGRERQDHEQIAVRPSVSPLRD